MLPDQPSDVPGSRQAPAEVLPQVSERHRMESAHWDERYGGEDLVWSAEPNLFLVGEVENLQPGRALDLGCGEGRNAIWLAECGWQVTGVDFSAVGLAKGQQLAEGRGTQVEWIAADLREYEPTTGVFDLVVVLYLHLPAGERRRILRRAAAALAAGGTMIVVGHDLSNLTDGVGGPQNSDLLFTPDDIAADLEGLHIERAERVSRRLIVGGGEVVAIDALVRAVKVVGAV